MENNTLKLGLIAATTNVTIETLNATFPRAVEGEASDRSDSKIIFQRNMRGLNSNDDYDDIRHRSLVYLESVPENPPEDYQPSVTIDRVLDMKSGCDQGTNCLLIISTVSVILEPGDDENAIKKAVTDGLNDSWKDGSFNAAIPKDTVICPTPEEDASGGVRLGTIKFTTVPESRKLRAEPR